MSFLSAPMKDLAHWMSQKTHKKSVYSFHEGSSSDISILGIKGACLCEMTHLQLPVPPGFVISSEASVEYYDDDKIIPQNLISEYTHAITEIERQTGRIFGSTSEYPLLLSIRAGATISMHSCEAKTNVLASASRFSLPESWCIPGISGTVLNLGFNDEIFHNLITHTGSRFAIDTYARHLMSFGIAVLGVDPQEYYNLIEELQSHNDKDNQSRYTKQDLLNIIEKFKLVRSIPTNPWEQLQLAINAMYTNWFSEESRK